MNDIKVVQLKLRSIDESLARTLKVFGDASRYRIATLLVLYDDLRVTDIVKVLNISAPAASYHLKLLELSQLVRAKRMGQMICWLKNTNWSRN